MKRSITVKQGKKGATITATGGAAADLLRGLCSAYGLESPFVNDRKSIKPTAPETPSTEDLVTIDRPGHERDTAPRKLVLGIPTESS